MEKEKYYKGHSEFNSESHLVFAPLYPGLQISGMTNGAGGGFTLIELLVVVLIIGILAAVALPQYQKAVAKARATEALTVLSAIKTAGEEYIMATGEFPPSYDVLSVIPSGSLTKYVVDNDEFLTKYYSYILISGRLDVGCIQGEGFPSFLWKSSLDTGLPKLSQAGVYCYYIKNDPKASFIDQICRSFTTNSKIDYGIGYAYLL